MDDEVNKTVNNSFVKKHHDEENQLLSIFPEEIWKMILNGIYNTDSLENCSNASQVFRFMLLSRRTLFLFPKMFQCLTLKFEKSKDECYEDIYDYNSDDEFIGQPADLPVEQKIWSYPGGLRLVCTLWNKTVDKYFHEHPFHYETYFENVYLPNAVRHDAYFGATRQETLNELITHFQNTHSEGRTGIRKNPFFQRSLFLKIKSSEIGDYGNHVFNRVLGIYGKELWYLTLKIENTQETMSEFYLSFKRLLQQVPNLRGIRLSYYMLRWKEPPDLNLQETIRENPLPELQKLRFIKNSYADPRPIFMELLQRSINIEMLVIGYCDIYSLELPKLQELSFTINTEEDFLQIKQVGKKWRFKKFRVSFEYPEAGTKEGIFRIFQMVTENWADTLENLMLYFPDADYRAPKENHLEWTREYRMQLPKLKILHLNLPYFPTFDFMLGCAKTLESITIHGWKLDAEYYFKKEEKISQYEPAKANQIVEYLGFEYKINKSNIWNLFPRLKMISVRYLPFYRPSK